MRPTGWVQQMGIDELKKDLNAYKEAVSTCHVSVHNQLIDARKQIEELNKFREYTQSCLVSTHTQHIDARKEILDLKLEISKNIQHIDARKEINELKSEVSSLKKTNKDILKKLEEQIQLNSKLCERIFEMKEEKFKEDEKIDL